jgi:hypothetical protein
MGSGLVPDIRVSENPPRLIDINDRFAWRR